MARLVNALHRDFPEYANLLVADKLAFNGALLPRHDHVMFSDEKKPGPVRDFRIDIAKTGYIRTSGDNIAIAAHNPNNKRRLIVVLLGDSSSAERTQEAKKLIDTYLDRLMPLKQQPLNKSVGKSGAPQSQSPPAAPPPPMRKPQLLPKKTPALVVR
jgi:D-alanyl-D-alanine carboxypeptidase